MTLQQINQKICLLEEAIAMPSSSITIDGRAANQWDFQQLQKRLNYFKAMKAKLQNKTYKPTFGGVINFGN